MSNNGMHDSSLRATRSTLSVKKAYMMSFALEQRDKADFYEFYRPNTSRGFQAQEVFRTFQESQLAFFLGDEFPACDASAFSWCGAGNLAGHRRTESWAVPLDEDATPQQKP
eukprot:473864-Amphidinium_carterae.1